MDVITEESQIEKKTTTNKQWNKLPGQILFRVPDK